MALRDGLGKIANRRGRVPSDALLEITVILPNRRCHLFLTREEIYEQKKRLRTNAILNRSEREIKETEAITRND